MSQYDTFIHLVAGGIGGTAGAIATCPLEVVKTRLQSSVYTFGGSGAGSKHTHGIPLTFTPSTAAAAATDSSVIATTTRRSVLGIWNCLKYIVETEGTHALFKGLGPNLVGVAPSRAIYFCTYSQSKRALNTLMIPESHMVHILSAAFAGFASSTLTNPIWMVKTRLQLDQSKYGTVKLSQVIKDIYAERGFKGFYKGITASYYGVSETIIHFVIYESLKARLQAHHHAQICDMDEIHQEEIGTRDLVGFMVAGAISKTCASCITYPHEVVRTRLRQSGDKYRSFFQTLFLVFQEEGYHGLYRGLGTQLVRQIPNTAIMMATYEAVVYLLNGHHAN